MSYLETAYNAKTNTLIANSVLSYTILPELEIKSNVGYTTTSLNESKVTYNTFYSPSFGLGPEFSSIYRNAGERYSWIVEPQINWKKQWGNHSLKVLVGTTFQHQQSDALTMYGSGFTSNSLVYDLSSANSVAILSNASTVYKYNAAFGRANYNYLGRYIINLTGRRDGSSRFGPGRKFANFGAVGAAWIFSEEGF